MVSGPPAGKRKRGRPRLWQSNKQHADASSGQHMAPRDGDDDDDDGRSRKRGKVTEMKVASPSAMDVQPRKRKLPRKSLKEVVQDKPQPESSPKSRARQQELRAQQQESAEQPQEPEPEAASAAPRRSRRRQQEQREPVDEQIADEAPRRKKARPSEQDASPAVQQAPRGRRSRPSLQLPREDDVTLGEEDEEPDTRPRNRARPSRRGLSPSQAQNDAAERRKEGRRPWQTQEEESSQDEHTLAQNGPRGAAATAGTSKRRPDVYRPSPSLTQTRDPKRRRSRQHVDRDDAPPESPSAPPPPPPKPYVHIVPRVRRVRQSTIAAKWSPLMGPSLAAVSALLHLAHRPILQRLSDTHQRRAHASAALRLTARRISRKVAARALPFPPASMPAAPRRGGPRQQQPLDGGRETELDFESVLDAKAALEAQLGPAAHAVELLRREKDGVERELERDYETLRELEARARSQAREQRGLLKKAHALTPLAMMPEQPHDARAEESVLKPAGGTTVTASSGNLFTNLVANDAGDEVDDTGELSQFAVQLGGHVESMRANLRQADGIVPQLARARAALQAALFTHLGQDQYERVVFG